MDDLPDVDDEDLPILDWEDPAARIRLSEDLRAALALPVGTIRWSRSKRIQVLSDHPKDAEQIENLERCLQFWDSAGPQLGRSSTWNVLFEMEERTYIVVIGRDLSGSHNIITVFGSTDPGYVWKRRNQPGMVKRKRK